MSGWQIGPRFLPRACHIRRWHADQDGPYWESDYVVGEWDAKADRPTGRAERIYISAAAVRDIALEPGSPFHEEFDQNARLREEIGGLNARIDQLETENADLSARLMSGETVDEVITGVVKGLRSTVTARRKPPVKKRKPPAPPEAL